MARKISVNGKLIGIPGLYSRGIELAGPASPAPLEQGVVAIIATSDGPLKPKVPVLLRSARSLKDTLGLGNLYRGCKVLFDPSREDRREVRGASSVLVVRPEAATQASKTVDNASAAALFTMKSAAYGLKAAGIAHTIAAGTQGGPSKKLTISQTGLDDEVFDNLGFLPALVIRYTGDGSTATIVVSSMQITTTLAGDQTDSSVNLAIPFSTYDTVRKITDYVNAQIGYEAVIVTSQPDARLGVDLDYLASTNVKTRTGTISLADTTTDTFTGTITSLADGEIIKVGSEYLYVINAAGKQVIRGYLDSTPAVHASAAAVTFTSVTEVIKRMMDTANNSSTRVLADTRTTNTGTPDNVAKTYLAGATQPAVTDNDYSSCLEALDAYSFDFLVVDSMSATVHDAVRAWLANRWGSSANEVQAHLGAAKDETESQIRARCKALQDPNSSLWFQDPTRDGENIAPWLMACFAAGIQAGMDPGTPLTHKSLRVEDLDQASSIKIQGDDAEDFVEMGASFARYSGDGFRITRCLSTWTNDDNFHLISPNVRYAIARTEKLVRSYIKTRHFGKKGVSGDKHSIKSSIVDALEDAKSQGLIVDGAKRVNGVPEDIPAFDTAEIFVDRTGNLIEYEMTYVPVDGNDFFVSTSRVAEWTDAA